MEGVMTRDFPSILKSLLLWVVGVALVVATQFGSSAALADGAVVLGRPADIAKAGVAIGIASNYEDNAAAYKHALDQCRANKDAPASTKSLCSLIAYFKDQCAAVAIDKKAGTPGFGWSIGVDQATAQREALAVCIASAGKSREKFCEQSILFCDGTAKQMSTGSIR
jgi:hypothetical protein